MTINNENQEKISRLYDNLSRYNGWMNRIFGRGNLSQLNIHKSLRLTMSEIDEDHEKNGTDPVNWLVLQKAALPQNPVILDAGCGFGGTVFQWYQLLPGRYDGLTLSSFQQKAAEREAKRRGIEQKCRFYQRSFEEPIEQKYDAIIAIEALIHSTDLSGTLSNFAQGLKPGGKLVIVDDMALDNSVHEEPDCHMLKKYWYLSHLPSLDSYSKEFDSNRLRTCIRLDLTPCLNFLSPGRIKWSGLFLSFIGRIMPPSSLRLYIRTQLGGIALQRLYQKKKLKYCLWIAEKSG